MFIQYIEYDDVESHNYNQTRKCTSDSSCVVQNQLLKHSAFVFYERIHTTVDMRTLSMFYDADLFIYKCQEVRSLIIMQLYKRENVSTTQTRFRPPYQYNCY